MGMSKGFPDLEIPFPIHGRHGLYIEFKTAKGRTSPEQAQWLDLLNRSGYVAKIARSFDDARQILDKYLQGENNE